MAAVESIAMHPVSAAVPEDTSAVLQAKLDMMRGNKSVSVLSKRLNRKITTETEGTSTTDTDGTDEESRNDSDGLSDASQSKAMPALDLDSISEADGDSPALMTADPMFMSPDPFDFMPSVRAPPAFSERGFYAAPVGRMEPTEVFPREMQPTKQMAPDNVPPMAMYAMPQMEMQAKQPMAMPAPQPMAMQAMQPMAMQAMRPMTTPTAAPVSMQSSAQNQSSNPVVVPVPVPMPFQMPFQMQTMMPQNVPVPKGFKLVRIPETKPEVAKSAISDPKSTERKIFVGGLNPITTGQTLREYFSDFGPVLDAKVVREGEKSKGFGFVQFRDCIPAEVLENSHIIDQRRCGVGPAFHRDSA